MFQSLKFKIKYVQNNYEWLQTVNSKCVMKSPKVSAYIFASAYNVRKKKEHFQLFYENIKYNNDE